MKSRRKNQRKYDSTNNNYQSNDDYTNNTYNINNITKKEKELLNKYKSIASEYLDDWEFIEMFKKNNYDEEQISKDLNKIILGDDFKWKEIKNGKPVTTRSTDQIRKKQRYYKNENNYNAYEKTEENYRNESSKNKRKIKGSFHKNINDFYHYVSKKPKRPFQKCYEVPPDYLPMKNNNININNNFILENKNEFIKTDNNNINDDNFNSNNNNKITPSKSANNIINVENNNNIINNKVINEENKKSIKKPLQINMNLNMNKIEETKNDENEKIINEEEQRRKIILIKGEVFKSLKKLKTNTETKLKENNKNRQKDIYKSKDTSEKRIIKTTERIDSDYNISNQDIKNDKALQKKYLKILLGNMNHYSKKIENNIKRATSKDSETSDDRPDTIKRTKRNNNIPTSSNIIQKKSRAAILNNNSNNINKNLRRVYEIDQRDRELEFDSKVVNLTINSCYDNPYRDQYLKFINEKRKKNPGKIVELIIPQFNNMYMPPYPLPYQYPFLNQNMYMYPPSQYHPTPTPTPSPVPSQQNLNVNTQNKMNNMQQINFPQYQNYQINNNKYQPQINQMSIPLNQQINSPLSSPMNSQINLQLSPQINYNGKYVGINNPELLSPKSNKDINSDNQINNMSDN